MRMLACWIWRDDRLTASLCEPVSQSGSVISPVCQKFGWCGYLFQKNFGTREIMRLTGRESKSQRFAHRIGYGMNLGRPSAA